MKRTLVFDTGPIITFALNNLIWVLPKLSEIYHGEFYIPAAVRRELIDQPLSTHKYKLEALQLMPLLNEGILKVIPRSKTAKRKKELIKEINHIYYARNHPIEIVHEGEVDAIACALEFESDGLVVDERNTRYLIETPNQLRRRLERKLHTKVTVDKAVLKDVRARLKPLRTIRTLELVTVGYELGIFDHYIDRSLPHPRRQLLEGLLWGVKLHGCSTTRDEIDEIMALE